MKTETNETIDANGWPFRLVWNVDNHWADVKVFQTRQGDDEDEYLEGFVKWDGCTELDQGKPHWCSPSQYKAHFALLKYIYLRAHELMERDPEEPWIED